MCWKELLVIGALLKGYGKKKQTDGLDKRVLSAGNISMETGNRKKSQTAEIMKVLSAGNMSMEVR
jgi:hypothetical protein